MGSVEIIVGQNWTHDVQFLKELRRFHRFHSELDLIEIRDIIDIVVNGKNITGHIAEESIFGVLYELLGALIALMEGPEAKAIIEFHCEPWEMALKLDGQDFLVSVYGIDRHHQVLAHDLRIGARAFIQALSNAAQALLNELFRISESFSADNFVRDFSARLGKLQAYRRGRSRSRLSSERRRDPAARGWCQGGTSSPSGWTISYRFDADYAGLREYCGAHEFDLHALLSPGEVLVEVGGETLRLGPRLAFGAYAHGEFDEGYDLMPVEKTHPSKQVGQSHQTSSAHKTRSAQESAQETAARAYPLLTVHALLRRCRQLLNLLEASRADQFECTEPLNHFNLGVQAVGNAWTVLLGTPVADDTAANAPTTHDGPANNKPAKNNSSRALKSNPRETLDMLLSVGEMLLADVHALNPLIELNQRWSDLDREVRELRGWFEDLAGGNAYHDEPENFIELMGHLAPQPTPSGESSGFPRRFSSLRALFTSRRWQFSADRVDFSHIIIAPGTALVPAGDGLHGLDLATGKPRWSRPAPDSQRLGLLAVGNRALLATREAGLSYLDIQTGRAIFEQQQPLVDARGFLLGAAVYPGEDCLVVCDALGQLQGISASSGAQKWSFSSGHGRFIGVHFWGPLIIALTGEGFLFALNPIDGSLLWKIRLGGLADVAPMVHQGRLYALTHDSLHHKLTIHALYPFTGRTAWQLRLDGVLAGPTCFEGDWLVLPVESHGQLQLRGVDIERQDPRVEWTLDLSSAGVEEPSPILTLSDLEFGLETSEESQQSVNNAHTKIQPPTSKITPAAYGIIKTDRAETTCFELATGEVRWQVTPPQENWLLQGSTPLIRIEDAFLSNTRELELRSLTDGRLLHALPAPPFSPGIAPEIARPLLDQTLLLGSRAGDAAGADLLVALSYNHYLARIK